MKEGEQKTLIKKIYLLIERNELPLPTLPQVATRIHDLIDNPNVSAQQIVSVISSDPVVAAHIIRSANSTAFAGQPPVKSVNTAVKRMGYKQLRNVAMTATMSELMQAKSPIVQQQLQEYWQHSRHVAAVSYVLALHQKHLSPDQALMAGLIHNIGIVPLCLSIDSIVPDLDWESIKAVLHKFRVPIGIQLLRSWNFSEDMVSIITEHENLHRKSTLEPLADYADVVMVANMQDRIGAKIAAWHNIAAVRRLGMTPADCRNFLQRFAGQLKVIYDMLEISEPVGQSMPDTVALPSIRPESRISVKKGKNENAIPAFLKRIY